MRRAWKFAVPFVVCLSSVTMSVAADLDHPVNMERCITSPTSQIMSLSPADLRSTLGQDYDLAKSEVASPQTVYSVSSRYYWANAAKIQCGIALGYIKGGSADAQSSQKCDCFTRHMAGF